MGQGAGGVVSIANKKRAGECGGLNEVKKKHPDRITRKSERARIG